LLSIGGTVTEALVGDKNAITASASFMDLSPYMSVINQKMEFTGTSNWNASIRSAEKLVNQAY
jgi:hypothetical protein